MCLHECEYFSHKYINVLNQIVVTSKMEVEETLLLHLLHLLPLPLVMDVNYPNMKVMAIVMMETTMLVVLMMEVTAAPGLIHHLDGIIIALFVNVKREMMEMVTVRINGLLKNVKNV